ncbi:hypothetical protein [Tenacibaculum maritimum]|uniref:hypothetical protein n=3 Tax=Tenacibaculum maritimum TaxID=107401 RepID=UPI00132FBA69|nr:hypothetical protein [Tenacibaculum maritimum]
MKYALFLQGLIKSHLPYTCMKEYTVNYMGSLWGKLSMKKKKKKLRQDSQSEEAPLYGCFFCAI